MKRTMLLGLMGTVPASLAMGAPHVGKARETAVVERTIENLTRQFVEGYNSGDVDKMMRLHGPTYIDVNLPEPRQTRAERRAYYAKVLSRGRSRIEVVPQRIEIDRDQALVWGKLTIYRDLKDGRASKAEILRYMEAWRRLPEGWRATWGMDSEVFN